MGGALLAAAPTGTVAADEVMIEEAGYGGLFGRKREVRTKKGVVIENSVVCEMVLPVMAGDLAALVAETVVVVVAAAHVQP